MRAMILAAGRGERLRPLTDLIPKPMVKVAGRELLLWHILRLKAAGIREILVNSAWLADKIVDFLGDGSKWGVSITHSVEGPGGLETAGGIIHALHFFQNEAFLVVNGDTYMDADYAQFLKPNVVKGQALLFMTQNPAHNTQGDFYLDESGALCKGISCRDSSSKGSSCTFSGAAIYSPHIFVGMQETRLPLRPVFEKLIANKSLKGRMLQGHWFDVGTLQRLEDADTYARSFNMDQFNFGEPT